MKLIKFTILILSIITLAAAATSVLSSEKESVSVENTILSEFMTKPTKELFKVWHSVMKKSYDYNTVEGIAKYRVFRDNVAEIKAHNAKNLSWTQGLNEFSDMTKAEFTAHFNLDKTLTIQEVKKSIRGLLSLDDFEEDEAESREDPIVQVRTKFDHRAYTMAVRNQLKCGSCWAFTTMAIIEGNWNMQFPRLTQHLSTQQLVDCDRGNRDCNGGWFDNALKYFYTRYAAYESTYAYQAVRGTCQVIAPDQLSPVKLTSFDFATTPDKVYLLATQGPVGVAVYTDSPWYRYKGGIYNAPCTSRPFPNHAVVVVGYGIDSTTNEEYWIIRNSWGDTWGLKGHMYIKDDVANMNSCHITRWAYKPKF